MIAITHLIRTFLDCFHRCLAFTRILPIWVSPAPRSTAFSTPQLTPRSLTSNRRTKINNDPNNTAWAREENRFGHKILTSQGWKPGDYLGAKDAAHAAHYTAANASHIRVILKDDNLGLGAKPASKLEPTGFDAFQGLLGRLNGKSEESIQLEQRKNQDVRLAIYAQNKWKTIQFVRGGLLVPDKLLRGEQEQEESSSASTAAPGGAGAELAKASKTRKREVESEESESSDSDRPVKKAKKEKKDKKSKKAAAAEETESEPATTTDKKSKKNKKKDTTDETTTLKLSKEERRRLKKEKKAKKEERKKKKEAKKASKSEGNSSADSSSSSESDDDAAAKKAVPKISVSEPVSRVGTPVATGRALLRGRYMRQKKLATMDDKSLNEVSRIHISSQQSTLS